MKEDHSEFERRLRQSLDSVDDWEGANHAAQAPPLAWFERLVTERKRQLLKARRRELAAFLLVAVWIAAGAGLLLSLQPAAFLALQLVLAASAAAPVLLRSFRERRSERR